MKLKDKIPPVYHGFFPDFMELEFPEEKIATCANCTLCLSKQSPYVNTKCCSYYPHLPNYLVGGILQDESPYLAEGKNRIRQLIGEKKGVTPYGIIPPVRYTKMKEDLDAQNFWEKPKSTCETQLCPYYDHGQCTIWKYRENLCVTYFCSSVGGKKGKTFWKKVNDYLKMSERDLTKYALLQLGWPASDIIVDPVKGKNIEIDDEDGIVNEQKYDQLWRDWKGREEEFYTRSYDIIRQLDQPAFARITGLNQEILSQAIKESNQVFIQNVLPELMILNPQTRIERKDEKHYSLSFNGENVDIPATVLPFVKAFNGRRSTQEICHLGYRVIIRLIYLVEELYQKNILLAVSPEITNS